MLGVSNFDPSSKATGKSMGCRDPDVQSDDKSPWIFLVKKPAILWTQPWAKPHRMFGNDRKPTTLGFIGNWDSFSQHFSSVHWFFRHWKRVNVRKKQKTSPNYWGYNRRSWNYLEFKWFFAITIWTPILSIWYEQLKFIYIYILYYIILYYIILDYIILYYTKLYIYIIFIYIYITFTIIYQA